MSKKQLLPVIIPAVSISLLILVSLQINVHAENKLNTLLIEDVVDINPNAAEPESYHRTRATTSDGGDFLKQINGVSTSRFGGRGVEPIIRGQSQTRLNILLDGSYVHGGCPNRMDPPASWAALETYEKVTVLKGVQTMAHGGGGSGGTVLFERDTRDLAGDKGIHGRVSMMGSDNHIKSDVTADVVVAGEKTYLRGMAEIKSADNYEEGDGRQVRSSYDHHQGGVIAGFMPTADRLFEFSYENNDFADALYPGAGMDSPEEQGDLYHLRYLDKPEVASIDEIKVEIYKSDIIHVMDNFSLRTFDPKKKMRTPTTSLTTGGRLILKSTRNKTEIEYGLDLQKNERDATLDNMSKGEARSISLLWPDISIEQKGIFAEATTQLPNNQKLKYGLRIDKVDVGYSKADGQSDLMKGHTANQAYHAYYGTKAGDKDETNIAGMFRYEKQLSKGTSLFTGLSRTVRTADATERGINKWVKSANQRWIGNPDIEPEKHHQFDLGMARKSNKMSMNASMFFDKVNDYILHDSARGQDGVLLSNNADIYRNVDAELYGIEIEGKLNLNHFLDMTASLATVHATNTTDDRNIAQTPPLNGKLQLDYHGSKWGVGSRFRFAARQDKIDKLSKQEVGETSGYGALDVYGNTKINKTLNLRFGVDNVFDRTYAEHASRSNLLDITAIKVNEPGRTVWLKLTAEF